MARSKIREEQVDDYDFLSEQEFANDVVSGTIHNKITTVSGELTERIDNMSFISLIDTPATYTNQAGKYLVVKSDETGLEYTDINNINFGSNFSDAISDAVSSTTSTAWQNKLTLTTETLPAGDYRVGFSYQWAQNKTSTEYNAQVTVTGTSINQVIFDQAQSPIKQNYYGLVSGFMYGNLPTTQALTIAINYRSTMGSTVAYIKNAMIDIWRVS